MFSDVSKDIDEYRNNSEYNGTFMKKSSRMTFLTKVDIDGDSEVVEDQTAKFSGAFNAEEDEDIE